MRVFMATPIIPPHHSAVVEFLFLADPPLMFWHTAAALGQPYWLLPVPQAYWMQEEMQVCCAAAAGCSFLCGSGDGRRRTLCGPVLPGADGGFMQAHLIAWHVRQAPTLHDQ